MSIIIKPIFKLIADEEIHQLEQKLKFALPEDYRSFLLKYNGGSPSPNVFFISKEQQESCISLFFGVASKSAYDIWINALDFYEYYDRDLLPIGEDPGGSQIIMGLGAQRFGKIYFNDHEQQGDSSLYPIANSFTDLLNKLYKSTS